MIGPADHTGGQSAADVFRMTVEQYRRERWERVPMLWRATAALYQWGAVEAVATLGILRASLLPTGCVFDVEAGLRRLHGWMVREGYREGYECPRCGAVSHHPEDARQRYCGRCHRFEGDA